MNRKSLAMLVLAVLSGLVAMAGARQVLSRRTEAALEMVDILVASRDLRAEEVLRTEVVKVVQVPKSGVAPGTFSAFKDIEDRWLKSSVLAGEPIVEAKLAPKGAPSGLVARIPSGMRAFTLEVNEQSGVSGFILPDHRVDILQVRPGASDPRIEAEPVLQDVLVLASGQVFNRPEDRMILSRTVTVAVTPRQAEVLVAARTRGPLTLSLRGLHDHELMAPRPEPRPTPPPSPPTEPPKAPEPRPDPEPRPEPPAPAEPKPIFVTIHRGPNAAERLRLDQPSGAGAGADEGDEGPALGLPGPRPARRALPARPAPGPRPGL